MSIENNNQQEQKNIVKPNDTNTIENVLQEKFNDPAKESFFSDIFNDPNIKNSYKQESIQQFIQWKQERNIFYRKNKETEHKDKVKMIGEEIDIFEQKNGNTTIINVSKLEDKVVQKEDKKDTIKDKVVQKEDKVVQKEDKVVQKEDKVENQNTLLESRKASKESYNKIDKTKYPEPTAEEINKKKNQINEKTKQKLDASNISTDECAKFLAFEQKHEKKLKRNWDEEFLKNFWEFKEKIWETLPFSETNNPKTTDDLIDNNESLNYYANNSDALADIEVPLNKELTYDNEEFDTYVKFIEDDDVRKDIKKNQKEIQDFHQKKSENTEETPDDEAIKKIYQQYTTEIGNIKNEIADSTQKTLQKRILGSCISWLASYFDNTTIDKKTNFADDFDVNSQDGFSIENDILDIKGKINGSNIGFSYNMMEWKDTNLQADDSLNYDKESDSFTMDIDKRKKSDLGIKMPTIAYLRERAERFTQDNLQKTIEKSRNNEDFQKTFKQDLSEELAKEFGQKTMVETRVKRDIQKNITVQTLQETFIPEEIQTRLNEKNGITAINEKNARELLNIRDTTTENMRSDELETFNKLIIKFDNVIQELENNNGLEKKRKDFFGKIDEEKSWATEWRGTNILSFFQKISKNDKINLQDLEVMISVLEKDASSIWENIDKFSPEFQSQNDKEEATDILNLNNETLRGKSKNII